MKKEESAKKAEAVGEVVSICSGCEDVDVTPVSREGVVPLVRGRGDRCQAILPTKTEDGDIAHLAGVAKHSPFADVFPDPSMEGIFRAIEAARVDRIASEWFGADVTGHYQRKSTLHMPGYGQQPPQKPTCSCSEHAREYKQALAAYKFSGRSGPLSDVLETAYGKSKESHHPVVRAFSGEIKEATESPTSKKAIEVAAKITTALNMHWTPPPPMPMPAPMPTMGMPQMQGQGSAGGGLTGGSDSGKGKEESKAQKPPPLPQGVKAPPPEKVSEETKKQVSKALQDTATEAAKPEVKPEIKPAVKPEIKPEPRAEVKPPEPKSAPSTQPAPSPQPAPSRPEPPKLPSSILREASRVAEEASKRVAALIRASGAGSSPAPQVRLSQGNKNIGAYKDEEDFDYKYKIYEQAQKKFDVPEKVRFKLSQWKDNRVHRLAGHTGTPMSSAWRMNYGHMRVFRKPLEQRGIVAVMVDMSGSMGDFWKEGDSGYLAFAVATCIGEMLDNQVHVYGFCNNPHDHRDTNYIIPILPGYAPLGRPGGGTPDHIALKFLADTYVDLDASVAVMISDGCPNEPHHTRKLAHALHEAGLRYISVLCKTKDHDIYPAEVTVKIDTVGEIWKIGEAVDAIIGQ